MDQIQNQKHSQKWQKLTESDVIDCLSVIESTYPTFKVSDTEVTLKIWFSKLKDYDTNTVKKAVFELIGINKFAPALSEIISECEKIKDSFNSIDYNYNYMTDEEREKMIEEIQEMIKERK